MSGPTIVVYGASGVVGELVAHTLSAGGANVVLAGRDRPRLVAVRDRMTSGKVTPAVAVAAAHDRGALDRVVDGAQVVVGCAGPYPQVGGALAAAAVAAGADYVDVAGDQGFVRAMHEEHDADARRRGVTVAPGAGGLGAIGDWAARWAAEAVVGAKAGRGRLADDAPLDEITIAVAVDGFLPAPAARRAMIDAVAARGVVWRAGRWDPTRAAARGRDVDFGELGRRAARSFPAPEIITVPRHVAARVVDGFIALPDDPWARGLDRLAPLAGLAAPFAGLLAPILETFVDPTQVPDAAARAGARFAVVASARRGFEHAQVRVAGHDVYALAAVTVADAALSLASRERAGTGGGVRAPSELSTAGDTLRALEAAGVLSLVTSFSC